MAEPFVMGLRFIAPWRLASLTIAIFAALALMAGSLWGQGYTFTTFAGTPGAPGNADGFRNAASFQIPLGIAVDAGGNVYVADTQNNCIRKILPSGDVTTLPGAFPFSQPAGVAVDGSGNIYVADMSNNRIRLIAPNGSVTTLAGQAGSQGSVDGTGSAARFNTPRQLAIDHAGNLLVADSFNSSIRMVTSAGVVTTFAGSSGSFGSIDGTTGSARFNNPNGIAVDSFGSVYVADTGNNTVRKISGAIVTTLAGSAGLAGSSDGTGSSARFNSPSAISVDLNGNLFVADSGNHTIRMVTPVGVVTTIGGIPEKSGSLDGTGSGALFFNPYGIAATTNGTLYLADSSNSTIRIGTPPNAATFPIFATQPVAQTVEPGQSAVFTTVVIGTPPATFQWQMSINGGKTWSNLTDGTPFNGSSTATLTVSGTTFAMAGYKFRCVATNSTGTTLSGAVSLTVGVAYSFTTFAGTTGIAGSADGSGGSAKFNSPRGVAVDSAGNAYIADLNNDTIRKITPSGIVSTFAGTAGVSGSADGVGNIARFNSPFGIAIDSSGNIYVADSGNNTIRKITPGGLVSTLAGAPGQWGSADGAGSNARFQFPEGLAVDPAGNVYVADTNNATVRKITTAGVVTTLVGKAGHFGSGKLRNTGNNAEFTEPVGVAVDAAENVYVLENLGSVFRITQNGTATILASNTMGAQFLFPSGIAVDAAGNIFVTDEATIRLISPGGTVTTLAGQYGVNGGADGAGANATFNYPVGVGVDSNDNLYIADSRNGTIRKGVLIGGTVGPTITAQPGSVSVIAGQPATMTLAAIGVPEPTFRWQQSLDGGSTWGGLSDSSKLTGSTLEILTLTAPDVDLNGAQYRCVVSNTSGTVISGQATLAVGNPTGNFYFTTLAGLGGYYDSLDGTGPSARFYGPSGIATDNSGNVYVADTRNHVIRRIAPGGQVATLAGLAGVTGSTDGLGPSARFNSPRGIATDMAGNVYVVDSDNQTIRKIDLNNNVTTVAGLAGASGSADGNGANARFYYPRGLAVDQLRNLYVADTDNSTIRKITPLGVVSTIAGSPLRNGNVDAVGGAARFYLPQGVAVDANGNIYVADSLNASIRKISPGGVVSTLAVYQTTAGTQSSVHFTLPTGICVDGGGYLFVTDEENGLLGGNDAVWQISPQGVAIMQAGSANNPGVIDGLGTTAQFYLPGAIAVDASSNLYVADTGNHTVRKGTAVSVAPRILSQPVSQVVIAGSAANFTVAAVGMPSPTYQWSFNGTAIPGATSASLVIPNLTANNTGSYSVAVSNAYGATTSNAATLMVVSAPVILSQPQSATANAGAGVSFSVTANGSGLAYQWYFNGLVLNGAMGSSYSIPNVAASDAGSYTVAVYNAAGSVTSNPATLTVVAVPIILSQPQNITANAGARISFSVAANGPGLGYQWYFNGNAISGATGASYTIASVTANDTGSYSVAVIDSAGTAISANAILTVNPAVVAPTIISQPQSQTVTAGQMAVFSAAATGNPAPTYQWQLNGNNISGATNASYVIANVQPPNAGNYAVIVTNSAGSVISSTATLGVNAMPSITTQPTSLTLNAGQTATFMVVAAGSPPPTYQWSFNATPISGATNASYVIGSVQSSNVGSYTVTVTNAAGAVTSNGAILAVQASGAPAISAQPQSQTIAMGSTVVLSVSSSGTVMASSVQSREVRPEAIAATNYQWYLNGIAISGATNSTLILQNVSSANAGSYSCLIANSLGSTLSSAAVLAVTTTSNPGRLVNLSILTPIQDSLTVGFVVGGSGVSGNQGLLIRAVGPTLGASASAGGFGYPRVMPDPSMKVIRRGDSVTLYSNTGWKTASDGGTAVFNAAAATGAFPLIATSLDSAVAASVPSVVGGYAIQITGNSGDSGSVIAEMYDNTPNYTATSPRLVNLSSLKQIPLGGSLSMGFVIDGTTSKTLLIRAAGPALTGFGYASSAVMADPKIVVQQQSNGAVLATNAGWGGDPQIASVAAAVQAFAFINLSSNDSAVVLTLPPVVGGYSATVSSVSGGGGNVIVEVYEVP